MLARIQAKLSTASRPDASLVVGIGDDAAIVASARNARMVLTTDAQIEGVHFERRFSTAEDIGFRALAINLSDLAAMGAAPRWALLSLALPDGFTVEDVEGLAAGVAVLAQEHRVQVIGGNLTRSPGPLMVDVTAVGEVRPRRALTRSGGRPGDALYVSGSLGAAAAGLEMLRARGTAVSEEGADRAACVGQYLRPAPRVRLGLALGQARAVRAAMDLSDGLADAAHQIAEASGCGVEIDADAVPIAAAARAWWQASGQDPVLRALTGGDDYELLVAVPRAWHARLRQARTRVARPALTRIGVLTKDRAVRSLLRGGGRDSLPGGFAHW